jgi:hypothetical protein
VLALVAYIAQSLYTITAHTADSHMYALLVYLESLQYIYCIDDSAGGNSSGPSALWFEGLLVSIEGDVYTVDLEDSQVYTVTYTVHCILYCIY